MKPNHEMKTLDLFARAWTESPRSLRLSRAWRRRLSAFIGGFKALLWNWS